MVEVDLSPTRLPVNTFLQVVRDDSDYDGGRESREPEWGSQESPESIQGSPAN